MLDNRSSTGVSKTIVYPSVKNFPGFVGSHWKALLRLGVSRYYNAHQLNN